MSKYGKPYAVRELIADLQKEKQDTLVQVQGNGHYVFSIATDVATEEVTLLTDLNDV